MEKNGILYSLKDNWEYSQAVKCDVLDQLF